MSTPSSSMRVAPPFDSRSCPKCRNRLARTPDGSSTTSTPRCAPWLPPESHSSDSPAWSRMQTACGNRHRRAVALRGSVTPTGTGSHCHRALRPCASTTTANRVEPEVAGANCSTAGCVAQHALNSTSNCVRFAQRRPAERRLSTALSVRCLTRRGSGVRIPQRPQPQASLQVWTCDDD